MPKIDAKLVQALHLPVPRYTSYPTAPNWEQLSESTYEHTLRHATSPLSLYIHIPFCRSMCLYCGCHVILNRRPENEERYVSYLEKEINLISQLLPQNIKISQLHFGGGTPTQLSAPLLTRLMQTLRQAFSLDTIQELAMEVDPRTVIEDHGSKLRLLKDLGFNRISFGVQDTDAKVQTAILRRQSREMTFYTYDLARDLGFTHINLDLIYGLPYQTPTSFERTIQDVLTMRPDRISLFSYAKVPWLKPHQRAIKSYTLPSTEEKFLIYAASRAKLIEAGYLAIGMDHFAAPHDELAQAYRNKTLSRNFQGYTVGMTQDMIGLGVTAIGYVQHSYAQNVKDLPSYYQALDQGHLPVIRGKQLSEEDALRKWVIHTLMCRFSLDKREFSSRFHIDFDKHFADISSQLDKLAKDGLVVQQKDQLLVTALGELFVRNVAAVFDAYLPMHTTQFSQSI